MNDEHGPGPTPQQPWQAGPPAPSAQHVAAYPSSDVLATHDAEPGTEPQRARWAVVALAGCLVLALVGGVSWAVGSLSGGGAQPEDALPAGAVAFAKVDLDPPAGQKIDGFRFLRKFPDLRERIPLDGDVRKVLFESFAEQAGWQDVDFDTEVDPWLGDRLGVAGYPSGEGEQDTSRSVVALQVTDAAKAEEGLRRLVAASLDGVGGTASVGFVVQDDYALLAESQELAESYARKAADKTLADDERYAADVAELGDGVAAVWVDNAAATGAMGMWGPLGVGSDPDLGSAAGRTTMVARFDGPDVFELVGSAIDVGPGGWATHPVTGLGDLPESSVLAAGLADGEELAPRLVDAARTAMSGQDGGETFDEMLAEVKSETGIKLPEDLAVLLGDNLVAALDGATDDGGSLQTAVKVRTDAGRAEVVIQRLVADGPDLVLRTSADGYVLGTSESQAARVLAGDGTLGEHPAFQKALPDLADADLAVWADPAGVVEALFGGWGTSGDAAEESGLEPIAGIGLTASSREDGTGTFRFRIVAR